MTILKYKAFFMKKLIISLFAIMAFGIGAQAGTLCPDGTYVGGDTCTLCPDGTYSGGSCELMPDGTYQ